MHNKLFVSLIAYEGNHDRLCASCHLAGGRKNVQRGGQKFGSTMAVGFTLLSIDPKTGTPSTALGT